MAAAARPAVAMEANATAERMEANARAAVGWETVASTVAPAAEVEGQS